MYKRQVLGVFGRVLQAKKVVLIGNDERMKKSITKEVGEEESAAGKYVLKKKDLAEQGMTAVHIV